MNGSATQADAALARARRLLHDHRTRAHRDGQRLDYGLAEVRALLASTTCCRWCRMPVGFDLQLDHVEPIARGGAHALHNLAVCCARCNGIKGMLTGAEFEFLLEFLADLHPVARQDIERRLLAGGRRYSTSRRKS
jgi:5-methylcytosine-specific restriction endonuclease McrA